MSTEISQEALQRIEASIKEAIRLDSLDDRDLLVEVLESDVSDSPLVVELLNRLYPDWEEGCDETQEDYSKN